MQSAEGARVSESVLPETDDDAVRIMTIHGAKGLQFPIVVCSGTTTQAAARLGGVQVLFPPTGGYQVRPSYPSSARRLGAQGTTMLRVHVLDDGRVGDVDIEESAGHRDLDQAAADAVRRWRFEPARRGDEAVAMWVRVPVEFRLK